MKDKNNIVNIDVWCVGEYSGNVYSFTRTQTSILTNKYSVLGEYSIKLGKTIDNWWINIPTNITSVGTYTATLKILNLTNGTCNLRILDSDNIISQVGIPPSDSWQSISLSGTISNINDTILRLLNYGNTDELYIDDIRLTSS